MRPVYQFLQTTFAVLLILGCLWVGTYVWLRETETSGIMQGLKVKPFGFPQSISVAEKFLPFTKIYDPLISIDEHYTTDDVFFCGPGGRFNLTTGYPF